MSMPITIFLLALFAAATPVFDVASVKPSPPAPPGQNIMIRLGSASHGTVTLTNTTLSEVIRYAYDLSSEDQISGPGWLRDRSLRVDILAKAPPETPPGQLSLMMRNLIAERFLLAIHTEQKPVHHLELSVSRTGPKVNPSKEAGDIIFHSNRPGALSYERLPMRTLAVLLSRTLKQPVLDRTGLTGIYDVTLEWTPDGPSSPGQISPANDDFIPDIYTALRRQLGLQLEMKKTALDVIVVDHAEKIPTGN